MWKATAVVALLSTASATHAGFNLLVNGDLEAPPISDNNVATGWTLDEPTPAGGGGFVNSAQFESFANHTSGGSRGLWLRPFAGSIVPDDPDLVDAHLYQDVNGVAGQQYTASAWFRLESNYPGFVGALPTEMVFAIEFFNGVGGLLSASQLDIDAAYIQDNTWQQFTLITNAPIGTESVRVRVSMFDGTFNIDPGQSAFVDDFVLVPTPGALALFGLAGIAVRRRRIL